MRIGIDVRVLGTNKALERYTRNLVSELLKVDTTNSYVLLTDNVEKVSSFGDLASVFPLPPKKVLTDHLRFNRLIKGTNLDLVFHPDNTEFFSCVPLSVVTLHDVIPWKFPEMILSSNPLLKARQVLYFKLQEAALRKATHILTVSQNSKKDISQILNIDPEKITVTYEGIEDNFEKKGKEETLKKYKISGDYIFYIGGFSPHKNVLGLVRAFALISNSNLDLKLVLGGKSEETKGGQSSFREIITEIIKNKLKDKVIFPGFIDETDLPALYQHAKVFVYPSLYEGFGFPPLEAMKAGVPVVTSKRASLGELLGKAAYFTEVTNPEKLALSVGEVLKNGKLRESLVKKGQDLADTFKWEKTAKETSAVFNRLLK